MGTWMASVSTTLAGTCGTIGTIGTWGTTVTGGWGVVLGGCGVMPGVTNTL